jgi:hypothetical protein
MLSTATVVVAAKTPNRGKITHFYRNEQEKRWKKSEITAKRQKML